jgi:hypothetical protein
VLESPPIYARSRYENDDGGAMPVTKKMTVEKGVGHTMGGEVGG